jgi:hypothetical protein
MCQKGGIREGSRDRSDGGYCRNVNANGNNLKHVVGDMFLMNNCGTKYESACRGILVMVRLEADMALILLRIDILARDVPLLDKEIGELTYDTSWYIPGTGYFIACKYQGDVPGFHDCFISCYLMQCYLWN